MKFRKQALYLEINQEVVVDAVEALNTIKYQTCRVNLMVIYLNIINPKNSIYLLTLHDSKKDVEQDKAGVNFISRKYIADSKIVGINKSFQLMSS